MASAVTHSHATQELDCGSDHRAVKACIWLRTRSREAPVRKRPPKWRECPDYPFAVEETLRTSHVHSLSDVHRVVNQAFKTTSSAEQRVGLSRAKPWDSDRLRCLRAARRAARTPTERKALSHQVSKETRKALRAWQTQRLHSQLASFTELKKLGRIAMEPVKRKSAVQPPAGAFADCLRQVYASPEEAHSVGNRRLLKDIESITVEELQQAVKRMTKGKCADKHGVVMEMFACGSRSLLTVLTKILNEIMHSGDLPQDWVNLLFLMLPKSGDTSDPSNWRPIAILDVTYKIFAKVLHGRSSPILEAEQPSEQMGFRHLHGTDDALLVLECVVGKAIEWNTPVWFLSLDLEQGIQSDCLLSIVPGSEGSRH